MEHNQCMDNNELLTAAELLEALYCVTPSHRRRGECWCGIARDIKNAGHERGCLMAQAAVAKAELEHLKSIAIPKAENR
jgi:hypothetical protein